MWNRNCNYPPLPHIHTLTPPTPAWLLPPPSRSPRGPHSLWRFSTTVLMRAAILQSRWISANHRPVISLLARVSSAITFAVESVTNVWWRWWLLYAGLLVEMSWFCSDGEDAGVVIWLTLIRTSMGRAWRTVIRTSSLWWGIWRLTINAHFMSFCGVHARYDNYAWEIFFSILFYRFSMILVRHNVHI